MTFIRVPIFLKRFVAHSGMINKRESNEDIQYWEKIHSQNHMLPSPIKLFNRFLKPWIKTKNWDWLLWHMIVLWVSNKKGFAYLSWVYINSNMYEDNHYICENRILYVKYCVSCIKCRRKIDMKLVSNSNAKILYSLYKQ